MIDFPFCIWFLMNSYMSCFFLVLLVLSDLLDNIKCKLKSRSRGAKGPDPMAFMRARCTPVEMNNQHPLWTLTIFPAVCWVRIFTDFPDFHNACMSARNKRENCSLSTSKVCLYDNWYLRSLLYKITGT